VVRATPPAVLHANLAADPAEGPTLAAMLGQTRFSTQQAVVIGIGILAGLRAVHRAGAGFDRLDASSVSIAPSGQARLTGFRPGRGYPNAEVRAAGRLICKVLGVDPDGDEPPADRSRAWLVEAARSIAAGHAGGSATSALMIFGDAAGQMGGGLHVERTAAGIEQLGVPPAGPVAAAVDRLLAPAPRPEPVRVATTQRRIVKPAARPRAIPPATTPSPWWRRQVGWAAALALVLGLFVLVAVFHPRTGRVVVRPAAAPSAAPSTQPSPAAAAPGTPDAVVSQYYQLVAAHQFDQALALWDDHLRALLGPGQYPEQRFADTTQMVVNSVSVAGQDSSSATVDVDLTEVSGGVQDHWVGSWRLVQSGGRWLLDEPDFQPA